jgi:ABC-type branched-subunit amino acid transport system substrate-binding protein
LRDTAIFALTAFRRFLVATLPLAAGISVGACNVANDISRLADRITATQDRENVPTAPPEPLIVPLPDSLSLPARDGVPPMQVGAAPPEPLPATPPGSATGSAGVSGRSQRVILTPPPGVRRTIPIGLLLPLTGPESAVGRAMLDAAQMAVFDIGGRDFVLLPRDTLGAPKGAREAAVSALEGGAKLLLGPLFAKSVAAVAPVARAAQVNMVAFSNDRAVAGANTYLIGLLPGVQIRRVITYARSRGITRFAALIPDTSFGRLVIGDMEKAVNLSGGTLTQIEFYRRDRSDVNLAVRRLASYAARRNALERRRQSLAGAADEVSRRALGRLEGLDTIGNVGFEAVLLPESGAALKAIAPLLPFYDIDIKRVRLLGMAGWSEPGLGREPALVGGWFAAPPPAARAELAVRYKALYRRVLHPLAVLAYDATALAAVLAAGNAAGNKDAPSFDAEALAAANGFAGTAGIFRLNRSGLVERGLAVLEVGPDGVSVVSPAPDSFADIGN